MAPTALLSVSDKQGLVPFARVLIENYGFKLLSSGGTANLLEDAGLEVTRVSDYTGAPEILGGRVKTLHPRIHGGILAKRGNQVHNSDLAQQKIAHIDLVVVNLYPFNETISNPEVEWDEAIENIDIGGPTLIRASAKNHENVAILTSPDQYNKFLEAMEKGSGSIDIEFRKKLAYEAFELTAKYDICISNWLNKKTAQKESSWLKEISLKQVLRYGENPHQASSWYSSKGQGWGAAEQLQGKELSTNNLLDLEAAINTILEFGYSSESSKESIQPASVVVKHTNPCGVAISDSISSALKLALNADRVSAFGGIIALNSTVDKDAALEIKSLFLECIVAPDFSSEAREILSSKSNLRLLKLAKSAIDKAPRENIRSILGGVLIQEKDDVKTNPNTWKVVTERKPNIKEKNDLEFAWKLVKHVRSNAIVIASGGQSLGIGAGQMNRVGSAQIALEAAGEKAKEAVLASDGFFPFEDTVNLAAEKGISAIIQPGGSIRDDASISACNKLGISMILTSKRHFLH